MNSNRDVLLDRFTAELVVSDILQRLIGKIKNHSRNLYSLLRMSSYSLKKSMKMLIQFNLMMHPETVAT